MKNLVIVGVLGVVMLAAGAHADKPRADKPQADKPQADKPQADKQADKPQADRPRADKKAARHRFGRACKVDAKKLCSGVEPGDGRIAQCLAEHKAELGKTCTVALRRAKRVAV